MHNSINLKKPITGYYLTGARYSYFTEIQTYNYQKDFGLFRLNCIFRAPLKQFLFIYDFKVQERPTGVH